MNVRNVIRNMSANQDGMLIWKSSTLKLLYPLINSNKIVIYYLYLYISIICCIKKPLIHALIVLYVWPCKCETFRYHFALWSFCLRTSSVKHLSNFCLLYVWDVDLTTTVFIVIICKITHNKFECTAKWISTISGYFEYFTITIYIKYDCR